MSHFWFIDDVSDFIHMRSRRSENKKNNNLLTIDEEDDT